MGDVAPEVPAPQESHTRSDDEMASMLDAAALADLDGESLDLTSLPDGIISQSGQSVEVEGTPSEGSEDSFTDYDLASLPPEAVAMAEIARRRMQADYTRKTTALAQREQDIEAKFGDSELATEAIQFYEKLHNDPTFALPVLDRMANALRQVGYQEQIDRIFGNAPTTPMQQYQQQQSGLDVEDWAEDDNPLTPRVEYLDKKIQEMEQRDLARNAQAQSMQVQSAMLGEIQRQESFILAENKHYSDDDLDEIYRIAPAVGGNLLEAQRLYEDIQMRGLTKYVESKRAKSAPGGGTHVPGSGTAISAVPSEDVGNFATAEQRALARLRAANLS